MIEPDEQQPENLTKNMTEMKDFDEVVSVSSSDQHSDKTLAPGVQVMENNLVESKFSRANYTLQNAYDDFDPVIKHQREREA